MGASFFESGQAYFKDALAVLEEARMLANKADLEFLEGSMPPLRDGLLEYNALVERTKVLVDQLQGFRMEMDVSAQTFLDNLDKMAAEQARKLHRDALAHRDDF